MKKNLLLLIADPAGGNGPAVKAPSIEELQNQLAAANDKIAAFKAKENERAEEEREIAQKVSAGLTREQAMKVIQRQKDHDAAVAKQWEVRRPAIVAVLKEKLTERETRARIREVDGSITLDEIKAAVESLKKSPAK